MTSLGNTSASNESSLTSGPLGALTAPITYVVDKMQDEIVQLITIALVEFRKLLMDAVNGVTSAVDQGFSDLTGDITAALNVGTSQILGIVGDLKLGSQDAINAAAAVLNSMEQLATSGLSTAVSYVQQSYAMASSKRTDFVQFYGDLASRAQSAFGSSSGNSSLLNEIDSKISDAMTSLTNTIDAGIVDAVNDINQLASDSVTELDNLVGDLQRVGRDSLGMIENAKNVMRGAGNEAMALGKREYTVLTTYEAAFVQTSQKIESQISGVETMATLMLIGALGFVILCVYLAYRIHTAIFRPMILKC